MPCARWFFHLYISRCISFTKYKVNIHALEKILTQIQDIFTFKTQKVTNMKQLYQQRKFPDLHEIKSGIIPNWTRTLLAFNHHSTQSNSWFWPYPADFGPFITLSCRLGTQNHPLVFLYSSVQFVGYNYATLVVVELAKFGELISLVFTRFMNQWTPSPQIRKYT